MLTITLVPIKTATTMSVLKSFGTSGSLKLKITLALITRITKPRIYPNMASGVPQALATEIFPIPLVHIIIPRTRITIISILKLARKEGLWLEFARKAMTAMTRAAIMTVGDNVSEREMFFMMIFLVVLLS